MDSKLIPILLAIALLAGCISVGGTTNTTNGGGTTPGTTPGGGGTTPSGGGSTLEGLGYAALMALGQPVDCDVTMGGTTMNLKILGKSAKTSVDAANVGLISSVIKDDKVYTDLNGAMGDMYRQYGVTCNWIVSDATSSAPTQEAQTPAELESIPAASLKCKMGTFSASEFATPGKVCTQDQLNAEMMAGMPQYAQ